MLLLQESSKCPICSLDAACRAFEISTHRFSVEYSAISFDKCTGNSILYKTCVRQGTFVLAHIFWQFIDIDKWQVADQLIDCSGQHNEDTTYQVKIKNNATIQSTENKCHLLMYKTYKDDIIGWACDPQTSTRAAFSTASAMGPRHCVLLMRSNASGWSCLICITASVMASCIVSGLALSKKPFCKAYSCATCNIKTLTPVAV